MFYELLLKDLNFSKHPKALDRSDHTVISDYKYSTITQVLKNNETRVRECLVHRFDNSLNIIRNLLAEAWIPRERDEYTTYLGEQSISMASGSYYGFKTISSDGIEWNVWFSTDTRMPKFAMSEG